MPTNLPVEARKKWNEAALARKPGDKLRIMQEFLSLVPKHKGTEKLRAQVKTKMAALRKEITEEKRRKTGSGSKFFIEKEGAAQIVIVGQTNVGRSSLLHSVTNAKVEVSAYPFATLKPIPGILHFEDLQFQLVEAPALIEGTSKRKAWGPQTLALARNADALILMVDLTKNPCEQFSFVMNELEKARIAVRKPPSRVEIERKHMGAGLRIVVVGKLVDCILKDVESLLKSYGISNALVKIHGNATIGDLEDSIFESVVYRPATVVANKVDAEGARKSLLELERFLSPRLIVIPVSCKNRVGLKRLGPALFKSLKIVRIYTKEPGRKKASPIPFILKKDSTIVDLAKQIHSDFYERFDYARVWADRLPFCPQKVGLSFYLDDKDVVELHVR